MVVDATIANSAGEKEHPTSIHCRVFLERLRNLRCSIGMTEELRVEWKNHHSIFSMNWLVAMTQRGLVQDLANVEDSELRSTLFEMGPTPKVRHELLKDAHLLEAGFIFGKRVSSLDDKARAQFTVASRTYPPIGKVCWVNPDRDFDGVLEWLEAGAPLERNRQLGNKIEAS